MLLVHFDLILLINNDMMQYVMWYCSYEVAFVDVMQTWTKNKYCWTGNLQDS